MSAGQGIPSALDAPQTPQQVAPRISRWKFASAALFTIGATSTLCQLVAAAAFGVWDYVTPAWSTGGLVALAAAIHLGISSTTWFDFRRKIWIWVAVTAVIAVAVVGSTAAQLGSPSNEAQSEAQYLVEDYLSEVEESDWKQGFEELRDSGESSSYIASRLTAAWEAGEMPDEQYCVVNYWLNETYDSSRDASAEEIISSCASWMLEQ